jgi:NitT/TauT family transport system substrate-binding protein
MRFKQLDRVMHILPVIVIVVIVFSSSFNSIDAQTSSEKPLKISVVVWGPNFLAYVAQEKGYFEKNNVDVNLTLFHDHADAVKDYATGEHDGLFVVYSDALIQHSEGIDTKVVYNVDTSYDADAIIGSVDSLTDLKGKKVGVEGINSFSHYFMIKSLENVGLDEGDVEFADIPAVRGVKERRNRCRSYL